MLETTGQQSWRCSAARQHECALAMGLAHHPTTCCTPTRVRYLQQSDWPHLLRLKDAEAAEETCEAAVHAYAAQSNTCSRAAYKERKLEETSKKEVNESPLNYYYMPTETTSIIITTTAAAPAPQLRRTYTHLYLYSCSHLYLSLRHLLHSRVDSHI